jgi:hypothetical protein
MGIITDLVNGEFAHLDPAAQQAAIAQAEKDLAAMPEADQSRLLAAVGVETQNKKDGALAIAIIRAAAGVAAQIGFKLIP